MFDVSLQSVGIFFDDVEHAVPAGIALFLLGDLGEEISININDYSYLM